MLKFFNNAFSLSVPNLQYFRLAQDFSSGSPSLTGSSTSPVFRDKTTSPPTSHPTKTLVPVHSMLNNNNNNNNNSGTTFKSDIITHQVIMKDHAVVSAPSALHQPTVTLSRNKLSAKYSAAAVPPSAASLGTAATAAVSDNKQIVGESDSIELDSSWVYNNIQPVASSTTVHHFDTSPTQSPRRTSRYFKLLDLLVYQNVYQKLGNFLAKKLNSPLNVWN